MDDKRTGKQTSDILKEPSPAYQTRPVDSYKIEDYLALPDDIRAELIDGKLFYMEAPSTLHQEFLFKTAFALETYIRNNHGSCRNMIAPLDVQLDCDNKTMVQPDIMVIYTRDKITKKRIYGAPDFCIEILSPSTRNHDMKLKLSKYQDACVKEYWMVAPDRRLVICYFFDSESAPIIYSFDTPVPVQIFNRNLTIDFAKIETIFSE